jgi:hypothetical protein
MLQPHNQIRTEKNVFIVKYFFAYNFLGFQDMLKLLNILVRNETYFLIL